MAHIEQKRIVATPIPGPRSIALHERRAEAVAAAIPAVLPVYVEAAEGAILRDVDGNQFIDFASGIAVNSLGHNHPDLIAAIRAQSERYLHTCFSVTPYEGYVAVAERLNALAPGETPKRTVLASTGSEAVENAIKIARAHTGRQAIVAFEYGYHGRTNLTLALTYKAQPYKSRFGPFSHEVYRVPAPYPYRWPGGSDQCLDQAFDAFVAQVHLQVGEQNVAAVILEPILGEAGFITPPAGYIARVAEWCAHHGVMLVADEVQTGFCRTGDWFACAHEGVEPDLLVSGKAIAAGMGLAAVTGKADVMDSVPPGGLGGTYAGNPVACAAALAVIDVMEREDYCGKARAIGETMTARFRGIAEGWSVLGDVRGRGAMIAIELVIGDGETNPHPALAQAIARYCHANGLLVMVTGAYRNSLRFLPPLAIAPALLAEGLDILEAGFLHAS